MENQVLIETEKEKELRISDLKRELEKKVDDWLKKSFNYIHLSVVEKVAEDKLAEHIVNADRDDLFIDWLLEYNPIDKLFEYADAEEIILGDIATLYQESKAPLIDFLEDLLGGDITSFKEWCFKNYEDDIESYVDETNNENFPMWNTLFEWRDSWYNSEETTKKCIDCGIGVVNEFDSFNNLLFFAGAGYSFMATHWIPLYLLLHEKDAEKYKEVDFRDL